MWPDMAGGAEMAAMRGPAGIGSEVDEALALIFHRG